MLHWAMTLRPGRPAAPADIPMAARRRRAHAAWDAKLQGPLDLAGKDTARGGSPEAWFLGPRAENVALLHELIDAAIDSHAEFRRGFHPEDPSHLTEAVQRSPEFAAGVAPPARGDRGAAGEAAAVRAVLVSMRYQGHMLWDQALPAMVGLLRGLLYNQNNVAAEASPVTTRLEIEAGNDLCRMLGYDVPPEAGARRGSLPWGHITSGGTVANIEALWAARNLKFAAVALRAAIREVPALAPARGARGAALGRRHGAADRPRHLDAAQPRPRRRWPGCRPRSPRSASTRSCSRRRWSATRCRTSGWSGSTAAS